MRILVTGGAGFIGSHTCDRLLALGHDVVVLDALTRPVHSGGRPDYLSPHVDFYEGDVRNRDLLDESPAPGRRGLPLRRVPGLPPGLLTVLGRERRLDRVAVRDHRRRASRHRPRGRRIVAGRDGGGPVPLPGRRRTGARACAPKTELAAGRWDIPCPVCGGPLDLQATPERISNPQNAYGMSKLGEEMVAVNLGRRYDIPTVALRYSIVQGPRQSVYNAYSGACRIFCLSYLQGIAPTLYEDGRMVRDYVNIDDVVDANVLVLDDDRAAGRVFNVGGGRAGDDP